MKKTLEHARRIACSSVVSSGVFKVICVVRCWDLVRRDFDDWAVGLSTSRMTYIVSSMSSRALNSTYSLAVIGFY